MTRAAFYAPMKPPDHPVPSGDREMARSLMMALRAVGLEPALASELQTRDGTGDRGVQAALLARAEAEVDRLAGILEGDGTRLWVTYHSYYKAPDLIGPEICRRLGLPYVLIEATRARSRLNGRWARFAAAAEAACDAADLILYQTAQDRIALERDRPAAQRLAHLPPFLPFGDLPAPARCDAAGRPILAAGMMRAGDKLRSYRLIAATLALLEREDWRLEIAGGGPAQEEVAALMAPFGEHVRFLGQLDGRDMAAAYGRAALFFWPGVNEAFGMVYLEAQAAGLPVLAQDRPGVRDVLAQTDQPDPDSGPEGLARELCRLLDDPDLRRMRGAQARQHVAGRHLLPAASARLATALGPLIGAAA